MGLIKCACGVCGQELEEFDNRGRKRKYIYHHQSWNGGKTVCGEYIWIYNPKHPRAVSRKYVQEHILIAEKALGKYLPDGAVVHHINEIGTDNRSGNLIICEDNTYHLILHQRKIAYAACGHASWRKCAYCKQYDDLKNMRPRQRGFYHKYCANEYQRERLNRKQNFTNS